MVAQPAIVQAVCDGLLLSARVDLAAARLRDARRPIGERRVDVDFFSATDRNKPIEGGELVIAGRLHRWEGARWCVVLVRWTGEAWKRVRRVTGPLPIGEALMRCGDEGRRRGLERV